MAPPERGVGCTPIWTQYNFTREISRLARKYPDFLDSTFQAQFQNSFTRQDLERIDEYLYKNLSEESKRYFITYAHLLAPALNHLQINEACFKPLQEKRRKFLEIALRDGYINEIFGNDGHHPYHHPSVPIRNGDVFFDCGANTGDTINYVMAATNYSATVYSFEPIAKTYHKLVNFVTANKKMSELQQLEKIVLERKGVGNKDEERTFLMLSDNPMCGDGLGSRFYTTQDAEMGNGQEGLEEVSVVTIDRYVTDKQIDRVDFIKMDVEGAETMALEGARDTIRRHRPRLAICLYHTNLEYGGWDLCHVPKLILEINPEYKFYFRHYGMKDCLFYEAVLYCIDAKEEGTKLTPAS